MEIRSVKSSLGGASLAEASEHEFAARPLDQLKIHLRPCANIICSEEYASQKLENYCDELVKDGGGCEARLRLAHTLHIPGDYSRFKPHLGHWVDIIVEIAPAPAPTRSSKLHNQKQREATQVGKCLQLFNTL